MEEITKTDKEDPYLTLMSYVLQRVERLCIDNVHRAFGKRMLSRLHDEANIQVDCETVDLILANKAVCVIVPTMRCSLSHNKAPKWSKKMFWENDKCFNICTVKDLKSYMLSRGCVQSWAGPGRARDGDVLGHGRAREWDRALPVCDGRPGVWTEAGETQSP